MPQPIALYYFGSPNTRKITVMLEELGAPYRIVPIQMSRKDPSRPDFTELFPSQKVPGIVDPEGPDGKPVAIFESGAILKYLAEKFGRFYGRNWAERIEIDKWLFWQVGGLGPLLGQAEHFTDANREVIEYAIKRYVDESRRLYGVLEGQLLRQRARGVDWVAGDGMSIADFACFGWARKFKDVKVDEADFPTVSHWLAQINARPATQRALAITVPSPVPDPTDEIAAHLKMLKGARG